MLDVLPIGNGCVSSNFHLFRVFGHYARQRGQIFRKYCHPDGHNGFAFVSTVYRRQGLDIANVFFPGLEEIVGAGSGINPGYPRGIGR